MDKEDRPGAPVESGEVPRRPVLARILKMGAVTWAAGLATPAISYLWPAQSEGPGQGAVKAVPDNEIPVGGSKLVQGGAIPILLIRLTKTEYRAFSAVCTHLGCLVQWRPLEKDIFCPCHGGRYDAEGKVLGGPPPRPLSPYPATVVGGDVEIRLSAH